MSLNQNWPRWVFASLSKWFSDNSQNTFFFTEGEDRDTADQTDYFEFRMNGPLCTELSKDFWKLEAVVNILVVSKRNITDIHMLHRDVGIAAAAFTKCIPIFRYGDDDTQLGVMLLTTYQGEQVKI